MGIISNEPSRDMKLFWWIFALRGGFSLLFACLLQFVAKLLGNLFFEPIMVVYLSLLLGFYVAGSGILLGVAAGFAAEHRIGLWKVLLAECIFAISLGGYIGISLLMTAHTLSLLAGIHAAGVAIFELALAVKLRRNRRCFGILGFGFIVAIGAASLFLAQTNQLLGTTAIWLSVFEMVNGIVVLTFAWQLHGATFPNYRDSPGMVP